MPPRDGPAATRPGEMWWQTDCSTILSCCISTDVSSLTRWGRLPDDCSWTMTASTMSSLTVARSTSREPAASSSRSRDLRSGVGEGGGVASSFTAPGRRLSGEPGDLGSGLWERFSFLEGGFMAPGDCGEGEEEDGGCDW